jgi:hypothetical protein
MSDKRWMVDIEFYETDRYTSADVMLEAGSICYRAWGQARRSADDPDRPKVGEEVAAARALEALATQLRGVAEHEIEAFEGHPVDVRL